MGNNVATEQDSIRVLDMLQLAGEKAGRYDKRRSLKSTGTKNQ